jgi:hypothetical protein
MRRLSVVSTLVSLQEIVQRYLATGVRIINDFGTNIRAPVNQFRFVLGAQPLHFGHEVFQTIVRNAPSLLQPDLATFDDNVELGAGLSADRFYCRFREPDT